MRINQHGSKRHRGVVSVEFALVSPVLLVLLFGSIVLGLGVFRNQQIAALAREGARWAAVHGETYQEEYDQTAPTSDDLLTQVIEPRMVGLDPNELTCTLEWNAGIATVTITYRWVPEIFPTPITLTSTSVAPVSY